MDYENLFKALDKQIEVESQQVIASARERAGAILQAARQDVERLKKQRPGEVVQPEAAVAKQGKAKGKERASTRKQGASKLLLRVKHKLLQQAVNAVRKKLAELPQKPEYAHILKKLIQEAAADFPECTRIRVNPRDASLAQKILTELRLKLKVEAAADFPAGVIASSADGRMSICNTLESRLERLIPLISPQVARILYG